MKLLDNAYSHKMCVAQERILLKQKVSLCGSEFKMSQTTIIKKLKYLKIKSTYVFQIHKSLRQLCKISYFLKKMKINWYQVFKKPIRLIFS